MGNKRVLYICIVKLERWIYYPLINKEKRKNIIMENLRESVVDQLEEMDNSDLVVVYNTYCSLNNDVSSLIRDNDLEGLQILIGPCPFNALQKSFYGDYNPNHEYVTLDGYANLESFNDPTDHISITDMLDTIMESIEEFKGLLDY